MLLLFALLPACDYGFTLPSETPPPETIAPNQKIQLRPRQSILPAQVTGPPPPDAGITAGQCSQLTDGGAVNGDCVTAEVSCGETIIGHTRGGIQRFDTRFYEAMFCTPATTNHDGGDERVYVLELPEPRTRALVYLDTPCADLDLGAVLYNSDYCPSKSSTINRCEMTRKPGTKREMVDLWNDVPSKWYLIVEGVGDEEGAFALTVQCEKW